MTVHRIVALSALVVCSAWTANAISATLAEQNELLFKQMQEVHKLDATEMKALRAIFAKGQFIGQGNPAVSKKGMTVEACREKLAKLKVSHENPAFEKICGDKYMAPLYNPEKEKPEDARACIDQFEFPNIPCTYPVVWVRMNEAVEICHAQGKRLCDAHEWEGACEGTLLPPDYDFSLIKKMDANSAIKTMRRNHNLEYGKNKTWAYGKAFKKGICATGGKKSAGCNGGDWKKCGSNHFPVGAFPECTSRLKVYDIHGNAAEHMNLPLKESQLSTSPTKEYGYTEMKGSWFIWDTYYAHQDWCRWRAPYWHGTKVMHPKSHHNYHLGFRCCKSVGK